MKPPRIPAAPPPPPHTQPNEMVAAAVADTGPEANWFVTISGERGDDGHVSIDRIDRGLPGNRRWCFRCTACGTLVCCGLKDCDDD